MPMPLTKMIFSTSDLDWFCDEAVFPCLLKPTRFRDWSELDAGHPLANRKVIVAENPIGPPCCVRVIQIGGGSFRRSGVDRRPGHLQEGLPVMLRL